MPLKAKRVVSLLTIIAFLLTQTGISPDAWAGLSLAPAAEVKTHHAFQLELPPDLGTVESLISGSGPAVIHIQEAHGNAGVQKKIRDILHFLKNQYGVKLVLLEGSAFKLHPELARFFPEDMNLTMEVLESLADKSLATGPELFLAKEQNAEGYGVENLKAYVENGAAFKAVLEQKEKTGNFLRDLNIQIERLTSPYLNPELRHFLKNSEAFDQRMLGFEQWLELLKNKARRRLDLDLTNPVSQIDWPMLVRIFKLKEFEKKLDHESYLKEKKAFLQATHRFIPPAKGDLYKQVEGLLSSPLSQSRLPDPETGLLFENMVASLPKNFNYRAYPNVNLYIGHLILRSELKGEGLDEEVRRLQDQIADKLARDENEKKIVKLLKDYKLLQHLFNLELTPEDYEAIVIPECFNRGSGNRFPPKDCGNDTRFLPSSLIKHAAQLNVDKRIRNKKFEHIREIDNLFTKALEFYRGAKERDHLLIKNVEKRLKESGETKTVVVTGGFHSAPFKEYFEKRGYNYALITPKMTDLDLSGREVYVRSILENYLDPSAQTATYKDVPFVETAQSELRQLGRDPAKITAQLRSEILKTTRRLDRSENVRRELRIDHAHSEMRGIEAIAKLQTKGPITKIILADDEIADATKMALDDELERTGLPVEVIIARDGLQALDEFGKIDQPDSILVMTDGEMPRMSGVGLTLSLRERGFTGPIIYISARELQDTKLKADPNFAYVSKISDKAADIVTAVRNLVIASHFAKEIAYLETLSDPAFITVYGNMPAGRIVYVNQAFLTLMAASGATVEDWIGQTYRSKNSESGAAKFEAMDREVMALGARGFIHRLETNAAGDFVAEVVKLPLLDASGKVIGIIATFVPRPDIAPEAVSEAYLQTKSLIEIRTHILSSRSEMRRKRQSPVPVSPVPMRINAPYIRRPEIPDGHRRIIEQEEQEIRKLLRKNKSNFTLEFSGIDFKNPRAKSTQRMSIFFPGLFKLIQDARPAGSKRKLKFDSSRKIGLSDLSGILFFYVDDDDQIHHQFQMPDFTWQQLHHSSAFGLTSSGFLIVNLALVSSTDLSDFFAGRSEMRKAPAEWVADLERDSFARRIPESDIIAVMEELDRLHPNWRYQSEVHYPMGKNPGRSGSTMWLPLSRGHIYPVPVEPETSKERLLQILGIVYASDSLQQVLERILSGRNVAKPNNVELRIVEANDFKYVQILRTLRWTAGQWIAAEKRRTRIRPVSLAFAPVSKLESLVFDIERNGNDNAYTVRLRTDHSFYKKLFERSANPQGVQSEMRVNKAKIKLVMGRDNGELLRISGILANYLYQLNRDLGMELLLTGKKPEDVTPFPIFPPTPFIPSQSSNGTTHYGLYQEKVISFLAGLRSPYAYGFTINAKSSKVKAETIQKALAILKDIFSLPWEYPSDDYLTQYHQLIAGSVVVPDKAATRREGYEYEQPSDRIGLVLLDYDETGNSAAIAARGNLSPTFIRPQFASKMQMIENINVIPIVTPLLQRDSDFEIDIEAVQRYMQYLVRVMGAEAILVNGATGEFQFMSPALRKDAIRILTEEAKRVGLIVFTNVTGSDETETLENAWTARHAGADYLVVAPLFYLETNEEIPAQLDELSKFGLPLVLYNNPKQLHKNPELNISAEILRQGKVAAIKDSSGDRETLKGYIETDVTTFAANEGDLEYVLSKGVDGIVASSGNVSRSLQEIAKEEDPIERRVLQSEISAFRPALTVNLTRIPAGIKFVLALRGIMNEIVLDPKGGLQTAQREAIIRLANHKVLRLAASEMRSLEEALNDRFLPFVKKVLTAAGAPIDDDAQIIEQLKTEELKVHIKAGKKAGTYRLKIIVGDAGRESEDIQSTLLRQLIEHVLESQSPVKGFNYGPRIYKLFQEIAAEKAREGETAIDSPHALDTVTGAGLSNAVELQSLPSPGKMIKAGNVKVEVIYATNSRNVSGDNIAAIQPAVPSRWINWIPTRANKRGHTVFIIKFLTPGNLSDIVSEVLRAEIFKGYKFEIAYRASGDFISPEQLNSAAPFVKDEMVEFELKAASEMRATASSRGDLASRVKNPSKQDASLRILVIDDDTEKRELAVTLSEAWARARGYDVEVDTANNPQQGLMQYLKNILREPYDLIIVDHVMNGMDGVEFIKEIKEEHGPDPTPIVLWSRGSTLRARNARIEDIIRKGYVLEYIHQDLDDKILFLILDRAMDSARAVKKLPMIFSAWEQDESRSDRPITVQQIAPSSLIRYADHLAKGFDQLKELGLPITVTTQKPAADNADEARAVTERAAAAQADVVLVQLHGSYAEVPVAQGNFTGKKVVVVVHRPEEFLQRYDTAEARNAYLEHADAIVLLGPAYLEEYRELYPGKRIVSIPHGFFETGYVDKGRLQPGRVQTVGSFTTWDKNDMRHISDALQLIARVREQGKGEKVLGYLGGPIKDDLKEYQNRSDVWLLGNAELLKIIEGGETGSALRTPLEFRDRMFELAAGRTIIRTEMAPPESRLADLEANLIDFNLQLYREVTRQGAAKIEYAGTLHSSGAPALYVVLNSPSMQDVLRNEGFQTIQIPIKGSVIDFYAGAETMVQMMQDPAQRRTILENNTQAASLLDMETVAFAYDRLFRELVSAKSEMRNLIYDALDLLGWDNESQPQLKITPEVIRQTIQKYFSQNIDVSDQQLKSLIGIYNALDYKTFRIERLGEEEHYTYRFSRKLPMRMGKEALDDFFSEVNTILISAGLPFDYQAGYEIRTAAEVENNLAEVDGNDEQIALYHAQGFMLARVVHTQAETTGGKEQYRLILQIDPYSANLRFAPMLELIQSDIGGKNGTVTSKEWDELVIRNHLNDAVLSNQDSGFGKLLVQPRHDHSSSLIQGKYLFTARTMVGALLNLFKDRFAAYAQALKLSGNLSDYSEAWVDHLISIMKADIEKRITERDPSTPIFTYQFSNRDMQLPSRWAAELLAALPNLKPTQPPQHVTKVPSVSSEPVSAPSTWGSIVTDIILILALSAALGFVAEMVFTIYSLKVFGMALTFWKAFGILAGLGIFLDLGIRWFVMAPKPEVRVYEKSEEEKEYTLTDPTSGIAYTTSTVGGKMISVIVDEKEILSKEAGGSFDMFPWTSRIKNGLLNLVTKVVNVMSLKNSVRKWPNAETGPHALHGLLARKTWKVVQDPNVSGKNSISFQFDSSEDPEMDQVAKFIKINTYELDGRRIKIKTKIINKSDEELRVAFGFHQAFNLPDRGKPGKWLIGIPARKYWEIDENRLPAEGKIKPTPVTADSPQDFRKLRPLSEFQEKGIEINFTDLADKDGWVTALFFDTETGQTIIVRQQVKYYKHMTAWVPNPKLTNKAFANIGSLQSTTSAPGAHELSLTEGSEEHHLAIVPAGVDQFIEAESTFESKTMTLADAQKLLEVGVSKSEMRNVVPGELVKSARQVLEAGPGAEGSSQAALYELADNFLRAYGPVEKDLPAHHQVIPFLLNYVEPDVALLRPKEIDSLPIIQSITKGDDRDLAKRLLLATTDLEILVRVISLVHPVDEELAEHFQSIVIALFLEAKELGYLPAYKEGPIDIPATETKILIGEVPFDLFTNIIPVAEYYTTHPVPLQVIRLLALLTSPMVSLQEGMPAKINDNAIDALFMILKSLDMKSRNAILEDWRSWSEGKNAEITVLPRIKEFGRAGHHLQTRFKRFSDDSVAPGINYVAETRSEMRPYLIHFLILTPIVMPLLGYALGRLLPSQRQWDPHYEGKSYAWLFALAGALMSFIMGGSAYMSGELTGKPKSPATTPVISQYAESPRSIIVRKNPEEIIRTSLNIIMTRPEGDPAAVRAASDVLRYGPSALPLIEKALAAAAQNGNIVAQERLVHISSLLRRSEFRTDAGAASQFPYINPDDYLFKVAEDGEGVFIAAPSGQKLYVKMRVKLAKKPTYRLVPPIQIQRLLRGWIKANILPFRAMTVEFKDKTEPVLALYGKYTQYGKAPAEDRLGQIIRDVDVRNNRLDQAGHLVQTSAAALAEALTEITRTIRNSQSEAINKDRGLDLLSSEMRTQIQVGEYPLKLTFEPAQHYPGSTSTFIIAPLSSQAPAKIKKPLIKINIQGPVPDAGEFAARLASRLKSQGIKTDDVLNKFKELRAAVIAVLGLLRDDSSTIWFNESPLDFSGKGINSALFWWGSLILLGIVSTLGLFYGFWRITQKARQVPPASFTVPKEVDRRSEMRAATAPKTPVKTREVSIRIPMEHESEKGRNRVWERIRKYARTQAGAKELERLGIQNIRGFQFVSGQFGTADDQKKKTLKYPALESELVWGAIEVFYEVPVPAAKSELRKTANEEMIELGKRWVNHLIPEEGYTMEDGTIVTRITDPRQLHSSVRSAWNNHVALVTLRNDHLGYTAYIALHHLMPTQNRETWKWELSGAIGGVRRELWPDANSAMTDALSLSLAMTRKIAWVGFDKIPVGGSKTMLNMDPKASPAQWKAAYQSLGKVLAKFPLTYVAVDINTGVEQLKEIEKTAPYRVVGSPDLRLKGDTASEWTAKGVYQGMLQAVKAKYGDRATLKGRRISVQGAGEVGSNLIQALLEAGAFVTVADRDADKLNKFRGPNFEVYRNRLVLIPADFPDDIYNVPAEIFSPNAINYILNPANIAKLKKAGVTMVAGAANDQLAAPAEETAKLLQAAGIDYVPDHVLNPGGVSGIFTYLFHVNMPAVVEGVGQSVFRVVKHALTTRDLPSVYADLRALEILHEQDGRILPAAQRIVRGVLGDNWLEKTLTVSDDAASEARRDLVLTLERQNPQSDYRLRPRIDFSVPIQPSGNRPLARTEGDLVLRTTINQPAQARAFLTSLQQKARELVSNTGFNEAGFLAHIQGRPEVRSNSFSEMRDSTGTKQASVESPKDEQVVGTFSDKTKTLTLRYKGLEIAVKSVSKLADAIEEWQKEGVLPSSFDVVNADGNVGIVPIPDTSYGVTREEPALEEETFALQNADGIADALNQMIRFEKKKFDRLLPAVRAEYPITFAELANADRFKYIISQLPNQPALLVFEIPARRLEGREPAGSYWSAVLKDKRISTALVRFAIRPVDDKGEYRLEVDPATQSAVNHGIAASNSEMRASQPLVSSVVIESLNSLKKLSDSNISSLAILLSNPDQTNPTGLITLFDDDTEIIEEREIPTALALGLLAKRAGIFIYFDQDSQRKPGALGDIILRILKADMSKRSIADFLQPRLQPFGVTEVTIDDKEVLPGFKNIHIHIGPLPIPGLGPQAVPPASAVEAESEMRSVTAKAALLSPQAALVADTFTARILRSPLMQLGRTIFTALVLSLIPPAMAAVEASPMIPDSAAAILGVKNAASSDGWILSEFAVKEYVLPVILDTAGVSHKPVAVVTQRPELRKIVAAYSELRVSKGGSPLFAAPDVRSAHRWLRRELQSQSETRSSISIGAMFYPADLDFSEILRLKQIVRDVAIVTDQMVNRLARDFDNLVTAFKGWAALLRSA